MTSMHTADTIFKAVRNGWMPFYPQFKQNTLELGREAVALWEEWLRALPGLPVAPRASAAEIRRALGREIPDEPLESGELLAYLRAVVERSMYPGHPGFMAYVSGAGTVPDCDPGRPGAQAVARSLDPP